MLIITTSIYTFQIWGHMLRNKGFYIYSYISKTINILKSIIEQKLLGIMLSTKSNFHFLLNGPIKELWGRPLKISFVNISKTMKNF